MKRAWFVLNLVLVASLSVAGGALFLLLRGAELPSLPSGNRSEALAAPQRGPVDLPGAIRFRIKTNAVVAGEATLVKGGEKFLFTLRPAIDLPANAPTSVRAYVDTHPDLEDKVEMAWKSDGGGTLQPVGEGRYEFTPPESGGDVRLAFRGTLKVGGGGGANLSGETALLLVCPTPWEKLPPEVAKLIGNYPHVKDSFQTPASFYKRPSHLYRVTPENENGKVSPHFKLGDFDLHFDYTTPESPAINQFPQYIALYPELVAKLEQIIDGLAEKGIEVETLGLLAGFRSPAYNEWKKKQGGVGGKYTKGYSTHMYGAAADFFVDRDGNGIMDDMDGDGVSDQKDAMWIRDRIVDAVDCQAKDEKNGLGGACGTYGEHDVPDRSIQTPNLHVDVRGYHQARWFINSKDVMVTDGAHWEKNPCPGEEPKKPVAAQAAPAKTGQESSE